MLSRRETLRSALAATIGVIGAIRSSGVVRAAETVSLPIGNGERPLIAYPGKRPLIRHNWKRRSAFSTRG